MDKLIKASAAVGILLVCVSAAYYFMFALPAIQKQKLDAQLAATYSEEEQQCSESAEDYLKKGQYRERGIFPTHTNHFNKQLEQCFISLDATFVASKDTFHVKELVNLTEGNTIASFSREQVPAGSGYSTVGFSCKLLGKPCQNENEFDTFISTYMGH